MEKKDLIKLNVAKEQRLAEYAGPDRVVAASDYKKEIDSQKAAYAFISGFDRIDQLTGGFEAGELVIVSGYTGHGKTTFCQTLTVNFAKQNVNTLWFSYEMTPRQFFSKFPEPLNFYLPKQLKSSAMDWVEDRVLEAKIKFDVRAVIFDHLHFLVDLARSKNASLEIGTVVRNLKLIALKHHIVIFLIAHTSMPRDLHDPSLSSIRDSSFITQEADAVFVITRSKSRNEFTNQGRLLILKHRRMGTLDKQVKLFYKNKLFYELDKIKEEVDDFQPDEREEEILDKFNLIKQT